MRISKAKSRKRVDEWGQTTAGWVAANTPPQVAPKHAGGRPTKYTPERVAEIVKGLSGGNMRRAVCAMNDIHLDTFYVWMDEYPEFSEQVRKAESAAEYRCVVNIMLLKPNWTASAWWLERKYYEDWGRKDRLDVTIDTRKAARDALLEAGLPADQESIDRIVAKAEAYATGGEG
jgi:transposase